MDVAIGNYIFAAQNLDAATGPVIQFNFPGGATLSGNVLAVFYTRQPNDSPQIQALTTHGYVRQAVIGEPLYTSFQHFNYRTSADGVADKPQMKSLVVTGVDAQGHAHFVADYVNELTDKFSIQVAYDIAPPTATSTSSTMDITITNNSGRSVVPFWPGHLALEEQWVLGRLTSMYVVDKHVTPFPAWYDAIDPTRRYVGVTTDTSPLNDGYSVNGNIFVSTHDTKRIVTDAKTVELSHDIPVTLVPAYEWYQDLVMRAEHSTTLKTEHLFDPARNQRLRILNASGLINDAGLFDTSVVYVRNDVNVVDGDNLQIRLGGNEQIGVWPQGASQRLTLAFTTGVPIATAPPTVATPAAASPNPSAGIKSQLSVLGADDAGEASLTYSWSTMTKPAGAADPTFSASGTNGAKNTTVTVGAAGSYLLRATISDGSLTTTSDVTLNVNFTLGQNSPLAADVNNDGLVNAQDILAVISYMAANGPGLVSTPVPSGSPSFYYDVVADGIVNVFDILGVISYMAANPPVVGGGEEEADAEPVESAEVGRGDELFALVAADVATARRRWSRTR